MWCLNSKDDYLVKFELYQGKGPKSKSEYEKMFGEAVSPLLVLLDKMPDEKRNRRYSFHKGQLILWCCVIFLPDISEVFRYRHHQR